MSLQIFGLSLSLQGSIKMWQRNWKVYRKLFLRAMAPTLVEPFIYLLGLGIGLGAFVREIGGISYLEFIAPGLIASSVMFGASYECTFNSFVRMRYEKVYDAVLATPLSIEDIVAGEMFWGATRSFLNASIFLLAITVMGLVKSSIAILLLPLIFLFGLMFGIIGMTFTALIPEISLLNYYFTIFITPLFLFSGIFFPVESLPRWAQALAQFTPLYHVVRLCRGLVLGKLAPYLIYDFFWIAAVTALLFLLPIALMKRWIIR